MKPFFEDPALTLYQGDALAVLQSFPPLCVDAVITDPPYGVYLNQKALALNGLTGFPIAGSVASRFRNAALMPYLGLEYVLIVPEKWNEPQMCRICGFFFDKTASPNNDGNKIFNLMRSNYASCNKTSQATVRQTHGIRSQADSQEIRKMGPEGSLYRLNKQAKTRKRNAS